MFELKFFIIIANIFVIHGTSMLLFFRGGNVSEVQLINHELKRKKRKYTNSGTLVFNSVMYVS